MFLYVKCNHHCEMLFKINTSVTEQHCLVSLSPSHIYISYPVWKLSHTQGVFPAELNVLCLVVSV